MTSAQKKRVRRDQALEDTVSKLVALLLGKNPSSVKLDDPLLSTQDGFDSYSLLEFVLQLEDTFGLSIPDEDLDPDIFHSIETIIVYLRARLEQKD
jgi:acyl carrier protein